MARLDEQRGVTQRPPDTGPLTDERELEAFGYRQQLDRSMGFFSSLSISISCMCITAGIFTVFAYSLSTAGPIFVWTWPIVAVGQTIVALVLAELAGRMPIAGYAYQWASRLTSSHYGWFVGWAGMMAFTPGFTGLNLGLAPILSEKVGIAITPTNLMLVTICLTLSQFVINVIGVKVAARINNVAAFVAELGASIVLTLILLVVGFFTRPANDVGFLTISAPGPGLGPLTAFLLSGLLGIWVLTGFEGAADLAEETRLARHRVPRAVVTSQIISATIGFFMILGLTINVHGLGATLEAAVPITKVLRDSLGRFGSNVFEAVAMVALYAGGLANMAAASRLLFSLSRDNMLPGSGTLSQVSPRTRTPTGGLIVVALFSVTLVVVGTYIASEAMSLIVGMASVGYYAVYALAIAAAIRASRRGDLRGESSFGLGRWTSPLRWIGFLWSVAVIGVLILPAPNQKTALMAGVFFLIAAGWYGAVLRSRIVRGEAGVPTSAAAVEVGP